VAESDTSPGTPTDPAAVADGSIADLMPAEGRAALDAPAPVVSPPPVEPMGSGTSPTQPGAARTRAAPIALPELGAAAAAAAGRHFGLLLDVGVEVAAVVGTRELRLEQVLAIQAGAIIDLDRHAGEPIELYVNGKPIALAEIVVVDGRLGARVVETLAHPSSRS